MAIKIMLTGGGTLGPVTPLLAIAEVWKKSPNKPTLVWVGTPLGPEEALVQEEGIRFISLSVPKLDRYAPAKWVLIPLRMLWSLWRSLKILRQEKPDVIVSAGGYVSVPLVWMGKILGIPSWIHQLDVRPGLANKIMAPATTKISVAWLRSLSSFPKNKTILVGTPVRQSILGGSKIRVAENYGLNNDRPTVLVFGGGTGSAWINHSIVQIVPELCTFANIVHLSGQGKEESVAEISGYVQMPFAIQEMADLYAGADIVICRAGMGTISELAALKKSALIIPIPDSHQEDNAFALEELEAAKILDSRRTSPQVLLQNIKEALLNISEFRYFGLRLHAALPTEEVAEKLAFHIESLAKSSKD